MSLKVQADAIRDQISASFDEVVKKSKFLGYDDVLPDLEKYRNKLLSSSDEHILAVQYEFKAKVDILINSDLSNKVDDLMKMKQAELN